MAVKMEILVTINGKVDTEALYNDLKEYQMSVTNVGTKTRVYGVVEAKDPLPVGPILDKCYEYGGCNTSVTLCVN